MYITDIPTINLSQAPDLLSQWVRSTAVESTRPKSLEDLEAVLKGSADHKVKDRDLVNAYFASKLGTGFPIIPAEWFKARRWLHLRDAGNDKADIIAESMTAPTESQLTVPKGKPKEGWVGIPLIYTSNYNQSSASFSVDSPVHRNVRLHFHSAVPSDPHPEILPAFRRFTQAYLRLIADSYASESIANVMTRSSYNYPALPYIEESYVRIGWIPKKEYFNVESSPMFDPIAFIGVGDYKFLLHSWDTPYEHPINAAVKDFLLL